MSTESPKLRDGYDDWSPDVYTWLQGWYASHANGDWEHEYGVEIGTLDNPGWRVEIDLAGTELSGHEFTRIETRRSEHDWLEAWIDDDTYHGACGPLNLGEVLHYFRVWATDVAAR